MIEITDIMAAAATLRRELRALLRSSRVYLAMSVVTGLTGLLCASSYPFGVPSTSYLGFQFALALVQVQCLVLWLTALTVLPAVAIIGVHQEIRSGDWEQLATTPLGPRTLYWCKVIALAVLFLLGAAAVLPISGVAFFLAGVELKPYLGQIATLFCFAVCMIATSLQIAMRVPTTIAALVGSVAVGLSLGGGLMVLFSGYRLGATTCYVLGFTAITLLRSKAPDLEEPANERGPTQYDATGPGSRPPIRIPDTISLADLRNWLAFEGRSQQCRMKYSLFLVGFAAGTLAVLSMLGYLISVKEAAPFLDYLLHAGIGAFAGIVAGFPAAALLGSLAGWHASALPLTPESRNHSCGTTRPESHLAVNFPDAPNPIPTRDTLLLMRRGRGNLGCALFFAGSLFRTLSVFGSLVSLDSTMPATLHAIDSLLWVLGAVITAALLSRDCERSALDEIRSTLLTEREFLDGKIRTVWRAFFPLLAGWYAVDVLAWLLLQQGESALRMVYHVVLVALTVPEFHIVLLLGASGATFGRNATARIANSILWGIPGVLVPGFAGDYLEYLFVQPASRQNFIDQFGKFVLAYSLLVGAALVLALNFARWRFRQLWRGMCE